MALFNLRLTEIPFVEEAWLAGSNDLFMDDDKLEVLKYPRKRAVAEW